ERVLDNITELLNTRIPYGITATELGLIGIYPTRAEAMPAVLAKLRTATTQIRLLGVAFKERLEIGQNEAGITRALQNFWKGKELGKDLQILVMHPMSSPAVFRALLETSPKEVRDMLNVHLGNGPVRRAARGYFQSQLFSDCQETLRNLDHHGLGSAVK